MIRLCYRSASSVTLALAFATKRMTYENLLVRVLGSCETMANASVVCTDKTGTLTQNVMTVVAGSVGVHAKFVRQPEENQIRRNVGEEEPSHRKHPNDFSIDQSQLNDVMTPALRSLFNEAVAVNSTAFQDVDAESGERFLLAARRRQLSSNLHRIWDGRISRRRETARTSSR